MSLIALEDVRARGVPLPANDGAAQDIIDEQESWLAARIGVLVGERTQTFYVGGYRGLAAGTGTALFQTRGKLGLFRFTDAVDVTDHGQAVDADHVRLIDRGSAVILTYLVPWGFWTGPYVAVTYTPNDEPLVKSALYDLCALSASPMTPYQSEQMGAYSYQKGPATGVVASKAAIAAALLPKHDPAVTLTSHRRLAPYDSVVVNGPELEERW